MWGGLVVEVTQRLEDKLSRHHRQAMLSWWNFDWWLWLKLLLKPMKQCAAVQYNWRTRKWDLLLRVLLPLTVMLAVVGILAGYGISGLAAQKSSKVRTSSVP